MEVEDHSIALESENLLHIQTVNHTLQVDIKFALLSFSLKLPASHQIVESSYVFAQVSLVDLLRERRVLRGKDGLGFFVEVLNFITDAIMNALIEDTEDIILLPHVDLDVLKVFLPLEQIPKLQLFHFFDFLSFHQLLEPSQQLQQLFDEQVPYDI